MWLPSEFNLRTFAAAGVDAAKLVEMPQPLDTQLFDPEHTTPLALPLEARFVFLSVFKWEARKGWDVLLDAYMAEFSAQDGVLLVLRVPTDESNKEELARWLVARACGAAAAALAAVGGAGVGAANATGDAPPPSADDGVGVTLLSPSPSPSLRKDHTACIASGSSVAQCAPLGGTPLASTLPLASCPDHDLAIERPWRRKSLPPIVCNGGSNYV